MESRQYIILFLVIIFSCIATTSKCPLHIVVCLSTSETQEQSSGKHAVPLWKQAEILLPAAELAANEVNNCSDVLNDYVVELLPIFVPDTDINRGVVEFVKELVSETRNIAGVIGIFDNRFANVILPLAGHTGIDLIQIVDPTALNLDNSRLYPHTFTMHPSLAMHVRAASFMFQKLNWIRVGLVYSSARYDPLYLRAAESFLSLIDIHISVVIIDIGQNDTAISTIDRFQQSGVLGFLMLLPHRASAELICEAQQQDLEYAWVLLDNGELDVSSNDTLTRCTSENMLLIRQAPQLKSNNEPSAFNPSCDRTTISKSVGENPYSYVLYDSVWSLALTLNSSIETLNERNLSLDNYGPGMNHITEVVEEKLDNLELPGIARPISVRRYPPTENHMLEFLHLQLGHFEQVGHFDFKTNALSLNVSITVPGLGPTSTYTYDTFPATLTYSCVLAVVFCFLFTTVVLVIHICYRNEQEVKASSAWLSLCMFLGCYFVLCGALNHYVSSGYVLTTDAQRLSTCNIDAYSVSIGIDLLLTTLLAKLLRIWRIFTLHGRTGKVWTDQSLLLFIGLVVLVKIVILIIWTVVDIYRLQDIVTVISSDGRNSHYKIAQHCFSEYYSIWLVLVYGYSTIIGLILIAVSVITRKIKQDNFKDTKKVSILISTLIYMALVCGTLWGVLRLTGNSIASKVIIGMAYCLIALLSEVFLFLPKILPPLQRTFKIGGVATKTKSDSTGPTISTLNSTVY